MVKEGNKNAPSGHPENCTTCLFKIGGPMCPESWNSKEDYIEKGPCRNWRFQGMFSISEMKMMWTHRGARSTKKVNKDIERTRKRYRNKVRAGTG